MKCESKTSKRAWRNPLAPMAQCTRAAAFVATKDDRREVVCRQHANRLGLMGWTVTPLRPEDSK